MMLYSLRLERPAVRRRPAGTGATVNRSAPPSEHAAARQRQGGAMARPLRLLAGSCLLRRADPCASGRGGNRAVTKAAAAMREPGRGVGGVRACSEGDASEVGNQGRWDGRMLRPLSRDGRRREHGPMPPQNSPAECAGFCRGRDKRRSQNSKPGEADGPARREAAEPVTRRCQTRPTASPRRRTPGRWWPACPTSASRLRWTPRRRPPLCPALRPV